MGIVNLIFPRCEFIRCRVCFVLNCTLANTTLTVVLNRSLQMTDDTTSTSPGIVAGSCMFYLFRKERKKECK